MYFLKIENVVFDCQDLQTAITKIADATNQNWILQNTPFELDNTQTIEIIKKTLKEKGLKIVWLADKLNITRPHLSNMINGKVRMPKKVKDNLFKVLEIM